MRREALIKVLAFFAAQRNYGYIDRLGNALDEMTAYEALKDALRDYYSTCVDRREKSVEIKIGGETVVICCPEVKPEELEHTIENFKRAIEGQSGDVIVRETRKLSLEALARKQKVFEELKEKCERKEAM